MIRKIGLKFSKRTLTTCLMPILLKKDFENNKQQLQAIKSLCKRNITLVVNIFINCLNIEVLTRFKRNCMLFPRLDTEYPFRNGDYPMRLLLPEIITVYIKHTLKGHSKY